MSSSSVIPPEAKALPDPPTDGVSALTFLSPNLLASTSWDGSVRVHDVVTNTQMEDGASASASASGANTAQLCHNMESGPLLSLTTLQGDARTIITGGLDGSIRQLDITTSTSTLIGHHTGEPAKVACSCLGTLDDNTVVVSAGWNAQCHFWDIASGQEITAIALPGKAFSLDVHQNRIVVATSDRRLVFIDYDHHTKSAKIVLERESSLKYQSRCVSFLQGGIGIALGSIEGRVAIEFLPKQLGMVEQKKNYAFKCHRINDTVYPVNCLALHPVHGTFATGGCDGTVVTWDGLHKKKLATLPSFSTSIAALAFSPAVSGEESYLAIAASYTFEEGERDHPRDEIFIRRMLDSEVTPKTK